MPALSQPQLASIVGALVRRAPGEVVVVQMDETDAMKGWALKCTADVEERTLTLWIKPIGSSS